MTDVLYRGLFTEPSFGSRELFEKAIAEGAKVAIYRTPNDDHRIVRGVAEVAGPFTPGKWSRPPLWRATVLVNEDRIVEVRP
jgi:hypothetical protein